MTSKEKADEIYVGFWYLTNDSRIAKNCALVAVDKILWLFNELDHFNDVDSEMYFYNEVREEIEKL